MHKLVITETHLAARLFRSGILKFFNTNELTLYITDLCYRNKTININNDRAMAKNMIEQDILKVVELDGAQVDRMVALHQKYKPKFVLKTMSALVYAESEKLKIISDDELFRDTASELNIKAYDKEWLVTTLVREISAMGVNLDLELVKEII